MIRGMFFLSCLSICMFVCLLLTLILTINFEHLEIETSYLAYQGHIWHTKVNDLVQKIVFPDLSHVVATGA